MLGSLSCYTKIPKVPPPDIKNQDLHAVCISTTLSIFVDSRLYAPFVFRHNIRAKTSRKAGDTLRGVTAGSVSFFRLSFVFPVTYSARYGVFYVTIPIQSID
jgi:hypothetical protein